MAPIQTGERINEIDIVRGLALFGILMVNMSFFKYPVFFDRYPSSFPEGIDFLALVFLSSWSGLLKKVLSWFPSTAGASWPSLFLGFCISSYSGAVTF